MSIGAGAGARDTGDGRDTGIALDTGIAPGTGTAQDTGTAPGAGPLPGLPASRWVNLPGESGPTHYVDFGGPAGGPVVVCVHGLGGSVANWLALAPLLTGHARVLAFDLAGHGRTAGHGRGADLPAHRAHLSGFLRHAAGGRAVVVGNSMGGLVSLLQARAEPASVDSLVLVNPALPLAPRAGRLPHPLVVAVFSLYLMPLVAEWAVGGRRRRIPPERLVAQTLALCTARPERVPADLVAAAVALAGEHATRDDADAAYLASARSLLRLILARPGPVRSALATVTVPTLLLHGARDRLVPVAAARAVGAVRPDWPLRIHADAGHLPQVEDAGWVASQILAWRGDPVGGGLAGGGLAGGGLAGGGLAGGTTAGGVTG